MVFFRIVWSAVIVLTIMITNGCGGSSSNSVGTKIINNNLVLAPVAPAALNNTIYFSAYDISAETSSSPVYGEELWKSSGSAGSTVMVKDINPGVNSGLFGNSAFTVLNNKLYFPALSSGTDVELYSSDGTFAGTNLVKDIYTGSEGSDPSSLITFKNSIYFSATDNTDNLGLWKSRGEESNTSLVKVFKPGDASMMSFHYVTTDKYLYFLTTPTDSNPGVKLWVSDGKK